MPLNDETSLADAHREFERRLPRRIAAVHQRLLRLQRAGWDINALGLLQDDVDDLLRRCRRLGLDAAGDALTPLQERLGSLRRPPSLPDAHVGQELVAAAGAASAVLPDRGQRGGRSTSSAPARPGAAARGESAPPGYWRRWCADAPPAVPIDHTTPLPQQDPPMAESDPTPTSAPKAAGAGTSASGAKASPSSAAEREPAVQPRIYHLTDSGTLSCELDQRMETEGFEVELVTDAEEMRELLGALPPDLVLVDAAYLADLEGIGAVLRATRQRTGTRIPLAALAEEDDLNVRLAARRGGADALIIAPPSAADVMQRLKRLLDPEAEAPFRILIVEDDRSQALFAESILRNSGMEAQVIDAPMDVLPAMDEFGPDLILMDLHMPGCNGMELTALIREREDYLHTPIVFLSGENDPDVQFEALDAGGDDFLAKPIRPRHLISAVQNRVQRARILAQRRQGSAPGPVSHGLIGRRELLDRLESLLAGPAVAGDPGGILFLEIEGGNQMRERLGLSATEQILGAAANVITSALRSPQAAGRFGDASFVVLAQDLDDEGLDALAASLRAALLQQAIEVAGKSLRLRASVGTCAYRHGFADVDALLNAAEQAGRKARTREEGVFRHQPTLDPEQAAEQAMIALVRRALEGEGFELAFQPIVAVAGGEESQYQALLRLRDENGELHPAGRIIPLAERADLIVDIDRWVIQTALKAITRREQDGRRIRLFVTQAGTSLASTGQADWLREVMAQAPVGHGSLVVDIRLDDALMNAEVVRRFCESVSGSGVQFCLSQFHIGTDGASLMEALPLSYVKLAPKYLAAGVTQAMRDELKVLIDQAHRRNVQVIGHRVEDAQAAATLWMSGIDFIQGNLVQQVGSELDFDFQSAVL